MVKVDGRRLGFVKQFRIAFSGLLNLTCLDEMSVLPPVAAGTALQSFVTNTAYEAVAEHAI